MKKKKKYTGTRRTLYYREKKKTLLFVQTRVKFRIKLPDTHVRAREVILLFAKKKSTIDRRTV